MPGEKVSRLRHAPKELFSAISRKLSRWSSDNVEAIASARPEPLAPLDDRQQDNWETLLAIGDLCGGGWPDKARDAALALSGAVDGTAPLNEELLADIREAVAERKGDGVEFITSETLVAALVAMTEKPWGEINNGKPITQNWLARKLKHFKVSTKQVKVAGVKLQRYVIADLDDALNRYLTNTPNPPFQLVPTVQHCNHWRIGQLATGTEKVRYQLRDGESASDYKEVPAVPVSEGV